MKKIYFSLLTWLLFYLFFIQLINAQPNEGGTPPSIIYNIQTNLQSLDYTPGINLKNLLEEDSLNEKQGLPLRGGISVPVNNISLTGGGKWTRLPDGRMMWQVKIKCNNAKALGVVFDDFYIPDEAELFLYDENKQMIIGAFTSKNNNPGMQFSTHILPGTTFVIEYVEPYNLFVSPKKRLFKMIKFHFILLIIIPIIIFPKDRLEYQK